MSRQLVAGAVVGFAAAVLPLALLGDRFPGAPQPGPAGSPASTQAASGAEGVPLAPLGGSAPGGAPARAGEELPPVLRRPQPPVSPEPPAATAVLPLAPLGAPAPRVGEAVPEVVRRRANAGPDDAGR